MKPEGMKKHAIANQSSHSKFDSCYDFTKLSEALNSAEGKPPAESINTDESVANRSESSSAFDFSKLSEALPEVEEETEKLIGLRLRAKRMAATQMVHYRLTSWARARNLVDQEMFVMDRLRCIVRCSARRSRRIKMRP